MRSLALILFLFAAASLTVSARDTNYFDPLKEKYHCIVCGKGPLFGQVWTHARGVICDDCEKINDRCAICGLPVRPDDGHTKTADGRFICHFDKPNAILTLDQAQELFEQVRGEVVDLYGPQFALKTPKITVNLFDVDYWSEKGRSNNLHAFGFAHSRPADGGKWTHEIIMLSGRTREEMTGVAAHEYTHLWINENRPLSHKIDGDTVEAICELTAYKLIQQKKWPAMQTRLLENPYTKGKIKTLLAVERDGGVDYVMNWVKNGRTEEFDDANLAPLPAPSSPAPTYVAPPTLPAGLKFSGIMVIGKSRQAVINGTAFNLGDQRTLKLRDKAITIRCQEIHDNEIVVELINYSRSLTLTRGNEEPIPWTK